MPVHTKALNSSINFFAEVFFNSPDLSNSREICEQEERPFQSNLDNSCFHFVFLFISTWFFFKPRVLSVSLLHASTPTTTSRSAPRDTVARAAPTNTTLTVTQPDSAQRTHEAGYQCGPFSWLPCFSPCFTYAFVEIFDHRDRRQNVPDNSELVKECHCCTVSVRCVSIIVIPRFFFNSYYSVEFKWANCKSLRHSSHYIV